MLKRTIDPETRFQRDAYDRLPPTATITVKTVDLRLDQVVEIQQQLEKEPYLTDQNLEDVVNLAIALRRPLLLQGDPGCGKTRLAYMLSYALGYPLEECYIKSTSRAQDLLYTFDAVSRLYDAQLGGEEGARSREPRNYVTLGPLGQAIARASYGQPSVVLIDEIDKADLDFPNDLLRELDRLEFEVPEVPNMRLSAGRTAAHWPIVVITHNEEKALPAAFLRRCIFHVLKFPIDETLLEQILGQHVDAQPALTKRAAETIKKLRALGLDKAPGLSDLIDWVQYHTMRGQLPAGKDLRPAGALLKQRNDLERAERDGWTIN